MAVHAIYIDTCNANLQVWENNQNKHTRIKHMLRKKKTNSPERMISDAISKLQGGTTHTHTSKDPRNDSNRLPSQSSCCSSDAITIHVTDYCTLSLYTSVSHCVDCASSTFLLHHTGPAEQGTLSLVNRVSAGHAHLSRVSQSVASMTWTRPLTVGCARQMSGQGSITGRRLIHLFHVAGGYPYSSTDLIYDNWLTVTN